MLEWSNRKVLTVVITGCLILFIGLFGLAEVMAKSYAQAQPAPTWEYAVLVYGNNDASIFTGDIEADSVLTGLLVPQDNSASNIPLALNVMGNEGWELVEVIPGGSTIYMFKRPKG